MSTSYSASGIKPAPYTAGIAPTWEQVFDKPSMSTCTVECPEAWQGDSVAVQIADQECARLMVRCMVDPPTKEEIRKAEARARRTRHGY